MEKTDSQPKQAALDNKAAFAGNGAPEREQGMGVDELGTSAGLEVAPEVPLATAEDLKERDRHRYELNADSKETLA